MLILFLGYFLIVAFQVPELIRGKRVRELAVFVVFTAVGFLLGFLYALGVNIPSQFQVMRYIVESLLHLKYPNPSG
ncbi:MAG TPA: hypothetical protein VHY08_15595 [Bacillota bacterium]|nr:hypothetical protein [Bacillota bacterium]